MPLRPLKTTDHALILDSWIKSFRGSPFARRIPDKVYFDHYYHAVRQMLEYERDNFEVLCAPTDEEVIQGWCCATKDVLHYVFIGTAFRNLHLARSLIPKSIVRYSHFTLAARPLLEALGCRWGENGLPLAGGPSYDPFAF
jgi:hypothetical protein